MRRRRRNRREKAAKVERKKAEKGLNIEQHFEQKNGRYLCKLCAKSISGTDPRNYKRHFRRRHKELSERSTPYVFWAPEREAELVRLVGEWIRKNDDDGSAGCMYGVKEIHWGPITDQLNRSNAGGRQLLRSQVRGKWNNMVYRLPKSKAPSREVAEETPEEINGFVRSFTFKLTLKLYLHNIKRLRIEVNYICVSTMQCICMNLKYKI